MLQGPLQRTLNPQRTGQGMGELGGHEVRRLEVELYGDVVAGDIVEIVDQPPAGPTLEDEALDETCAEQDQRQE